MNNATLSFGVVGPTMDFTTSISVSEEGAGKILNYLVNGTNYGVVKEDDIVRPATPEEAAQGFAMGILQGLLDQTTRYEKEVAARAASDAIAPVTAE